MSPHGNPKGESLRPSAEGTPMSPVNPSNLPAAAPTGVREAAAAPLQFLRVALGDQMCAVRIDAVREILELVPLTPLPLTPPFVRGVMNLRGAVVPVIDLGERVGLPPTVMGRRTCVVIVDLAAEVQAQGEDDEGPIVSTVTQTLGVLVDAVHEVFDTAPDDLEPVPRLGTRIEPRWIRSMVRVRGEATPELDLDQALHHRALAELISTHLSLH